jgi:hypothetical protein
MKTLKFAAYLLYEYYSSGPSRDIKYLYTITSLTVLAYLHILQIVLVFDIEGILPKKNENKWIDWLTMLILILPILLFFRFLIKERDLKAMQYSKEVKRIGYLNLIVYGIASFGLLMVIAFA